MRSLDTETIQHMAYFQEQTGAMVRDCVVDDDCIYFLLETGSMKKALANKGEKVKKMQNQLNKRVKVWEYNENNEIFLKNLLPQAEKIELNGKRAQVTIPNEEKGKVIGKEGSNINNLREILKRNSDIENLDLK